MDWSEPRLLIADDDRDFRESLSEVFERRGYRTSLAADGCEALEIIGSQSNVHVALFDMHMPKLNGLDALAELRSGKHGNLPCILMSAKLDDSIKEQAEKLEIASLLSKPFTLRLITTTVEQILRDAYGWPKI